MRIILTAAIAILCLHAANAEPSLKGYPSILIAKVQELKRHCGARVISAFRKNARVAGTRTRSLHADRRAVDLAGNPSCMYARLKNWPGGASTDYSRVKHLHLSYDPQGGKEMGARFVHRRPRVGYGG